VESSVPSIDRSPFLEARVYTLTEAALYTRARVPLVRRWLDRLEETPTLDRENGRTPEATAAPARQAVRRRRLCFLDLIELRAAVVLVGGDATHAGLSILAMVRGLYTVRWGHHPFARQRLIRDKAEHVRPEALYDLSWGFGPGIEMRFRHLQSEFEQNVDFQGGYAVRLRPFGAAVPVEIDPFRAAGQLTISGRGVTIRTLRDRLAAGDSLADLAKDYDLEPATIEQAIASPTAA
jgi:uncharacterized protein (DUF433 family)